MRHRKLLTGPGRELDPSVFDDAGTVLLESIRRDDQNSFSWLFQDPVKVIRCHDSRMVASGLSQIEESTGKGFYAAGYISYEAGAAWTPGARHAEAKDFPLLWFGLYDKAQRFDSPLLFPASDHADEPIEHSLDISGSEYEECVRSIGQLIRDGETYQVNYTTRTRFQWDHGAWQLYLRLRRTQPVPYGAFLNCGKFSIVSLSPELFIVKDDNTLYTRPMKGTAPRGTDPCSDDRQREWLLNDPKNLAENRMIVDLMRNDLGSIAQTGTVQVHEPFKVEALSSLFQMTSGVKCALRKGVHLPELLRAIFPPGSITGAPKINTMKIISQLEKSPRNVYTGAIGMVHPNRDLIMSVAIRTITVNESGACEMGVGSGIVADSVPRDEFRETCIKAGFLNSHSHENSDLFETVLMKENGSLLWYQEHLDRLQRSAADLGYHFDREAADSAVYDQLGHGARGPAMIRILLTRVGDISVQAVPVTPLPDKPGLLIISRYQTDPSDRTLRHKTTSRQMYDRELAEARKMGCVDVLFTNASGHLTEGAVTNLFVLGDSGWITPDLQCGLLPGIWRKKFLEKTGAAESILKIADLTTAKSIISGNSVRGSIQIDKVIDADGALLYTREGTVFIPQITSRFSFPGNQVL